MAPAAGERKSNCTSLGVSPAFFSASRTSPFAELPSGTAIFLPLSSATVWIGEPFGTMMSSSGIVVLM